jgi:hypothetical protein
MNTKSNLTESEIQQNYEEFLVIIKTLFQGERQEKLLKMYDQENLGISLATSPASTSRFFHNCWPGGYIQHIYRVLKCSILQKELFSKMDMTIDFTDEEMVFAAMHHDLGKLGDPSFGDYYIPSDDWQTKKGQLYILNPNLPFMEVPDRSLYLLQKYGIETTLKEHLTIKLSNGVFDDAARKYLQQYNPDMFLCSNLPRVIQQSRTVASDGEYDLWKQSSLK